MWGSLLVVAALSSRAAAQTAGVSLSDDCIMRDEERRDSWDHVFGLSPSECEHRGFCWARHEVPGIPWCYWKRDEGLVDPEECAAASSSRTECADKGAKIDERICTAKACCWAGGEPGQPWCFLPGKPGATPKSKAPRAAARSEAKQLPPTPLPTPIKSPVPRPTPPPANWRPDAHAARSEL